MNLRALSPSEIRIQELRDRRERERSAREKCNALSREVGRHIKVCEALIAVTKKASPEHTALCYSLRDLVAAQKRFLLTEA
jgi:hypothetical protein